MPNAAKHTPGPWKQVSNIYPLGKTKVGAGDYGCVADTSGCRPSREENESNARLIAAAPDLLAAARWALKNLEEVAIPSADKRGSVTSLNSAAERLSAAIARAEGRQDA